MKENEISKILVDAFMKVHSELVPGLLESVYEAVISQKDKNSALSASLRATND